MRVNIGEGGDPCSRFHRNVSIRCDGLTDPENATPGMPLTIPLGVVRCIISKTAKYQQQQQPTALDTVPLFVAPLPMPMGWACPATINMLKTTSLTPECQSWPPHGSGVARPCNLGSRMPLAMLGGNFEPTPQRPSLLSDRGHLITSASKSTKKGKHQQARPRTQ